MYTNEKVVLTGKIYFHHHHVGNGITQTNKKKPQLAVS